MCDDGGTCGGAAARYPLHWAVWHNDPAALARQLDEAHVDCEATDCRGRTAVMLAVTLGHVECVRVLLQHGCIVNTTTPDGWTVWHEAIASGDRQLAEMVLRERDVQRHNNRARTLPLLLRRLTETPDFYVEIKWEFASWVPLVSRLCPHDTYKVYKRGCRVRIDTTLLGFDQSSWQRGNRSYIFKGQELSPVFGNRSYLFNLTDNGQGDHVVMTEVDHEQQVVNSEQFHVTSDDILGEVVVGDSTQLLETRLTAPVTTTYIDVDKINFERNKSGLWGWRSDRNEDVSGCSCKVFSANNVQLVTKTRTEHLDNQEEEGTGGDEVVAPHHPLHSVLAAAVQHDTPPDPTQPPTTPTTSSPAADDDVTTAAADDDEGVTSQNGGRRSSATWDNSTGGVSAREYFDAAVSLDGRHIGRRQKCSVKTKTLKATVWLCEEYPLSLQEQVIPIIDLMSVHSAHFAKLNEFIQLQLPSGFPVKVEIPLFHVLTARVTFGNIFGVESPVAHVSTVREPQDNRLSCVLDEQLFEAPAHYNNVGSGVIRRYDSADREDELLQVAIQQSLLDSGSENEQVDIWEALRTGSVTPVSGGGGGGGGGIRSSNENTQLARAIELSLQSYTTPRPRSPVAQHQEDNNDDDDAATRTPTDSELTQVLELSRHEHQLQLDRLAEREQQMLEAALSLSLREQ